MFIPCSLFVIVFTSAVQSVTSQSTSCHDSYSCTNVKNITTTSSNIECYGYQSCSSIDLIYGISSADIYCGGSFSCFNVTTITASAARTNSIYCNGLYSCAYVSNINSYNQLECNGEKSCYNTNIELDTIGTISCPASESCGNSIINNGDSIALSGYGSGHNSVFYGTRWKKIEYDFNGAESGKNTTILCGKDMICDIYCYGNGCSNKNGFNIVCDYNCTINIYCDNELITDLCPMYYFNGSNDNSNYNKIDVSSMVSPLELQNITELYDSLPLNLLDMEHGGNNNNFESSTINNSAIICDSKLNTIENSIICDDYYSCQSSNITNNDAPICCTGNNACDYTYQIKSTMFYNNTNTNIGIRCDGSNSCFESENGVKSLNGANIYFTGQGGYSYDKTINIEGSYQIYKNNDNNQFTYYNNIYATGYQSVECMKIKYFNNVYCLGSQSCYQSKIFNITNVYVYAPNGIQMGTISNVTQSVYCIGNAPCPYITMTNVGGTVFGSGFRALRDTTIINADRIFCFGTKSCQTAEMENVRTINVIGDDALISAQITSALTENGHSSNDNIFRLYVYGNNSDSYDVNCSNSDICYIYCQSSLACTKMNLHCLDSNSQCTVDCNENRGIACPIAINYNYTVIQYPTTTTTATTSMMNTTMNLTNTIDSSSNSGSNGSRSNKSSNELTWVTYVIISIAAICTLIAIICAIFCLKKWKQLNDTISHLHYIQLQDNGSHNDNIIIAPMSNQLLPNTNDSNLMSPLRYKGFESPMILSSPQEGGPDKLIITTKSEYDKQNKLDTLELKQGEQSRSHMKSVSSIKLGASIAKNDHNNNNNNHFQMASSGGDSIMNAYGPGAALRVSEGNINGASFDEKKENKRNVYHFVDNSNDTIENEDYKGDENENENENESDNDDDNDNDASSASDNSQDSDGLYQRNGNTLDENNETESGKDRQDGQDDERSSIVIAKTFKEKTTTNTPQNKETQGNGKQFYGKGKSTKSSKNQSSK